MSYQKMKACPKCGCGVTVYGYDSGWKMVECDNCFYFGPGEGSIKEAIKSHNKSVAEKSA